MVRRSRGMLLLLLAALSARCASPTIKIGTDSDQTQPALTTAVDELGSLWVVAAYTDQSAPAVSKMGLSIRTPTGEWDTYPPLVPEGALFHPSGDAWLATAQRGSRAYYISLLTLAPSVTSETEDDQADGLALAVVDLAEGHPVVAAPRRIDLGSWPGWDEPTISATRPPGATDDTILVAGTPIGPNYQDVVSVLVSHDGGVTFHETATLLAPGSPGRVFGRPDNTVVRPYLQQDPRPGQECHAYLAFGVYYATALRNTPGVAPPTCLVESGGCRSIAETETQDCGETWSAPTFIAVDTGVPGGLDFRGFGYAVANDGTRFVIFGDEDADDAPVLLKRAPAGLPFVVTQTIDGQASWADGGLETIAAGPSDSGKSVRRWRPTVDASSVVTALWVEEETGTQSSTVRFSLSTVSSPSLWSRSEPVDSHSAGIVCDSHVPEDDYMGVTPEAPFGSPGSQFLVAWTDFSACDHLDPHHIVVGRVK